MTYFGNEYIPLYFYSTVFQGNMALVGITAVFTIFRLQALSTQAELLFGQMKDRVVEPIVKQIPAADFAKYLQNTTRGYALLKKLKSWQEDQGQSHHQNILRSYAQQLLADKDFMELAVKEHAQRTLHNTFVERLVVPFRLTLLICMISLVLLVVGHGFHKVDPVLSTLAMVGVIVIQAFSLRQIKSYALFALVDPDAEKV